MAETELLPCIADAWQELLDKDDRTSPEEYPEMALITRDELAEFMARASRRIPSPSEGGGEGSSGAVAPPIEHGQSAASALEGALTNLRSFIKCGAPTKEIEDRGLRLVDALAAALTKPERGP